MGFFDRKVKLTRAENAKLKEARRGVKRAKKSQKRHERLEDLKYQTEMYKAKGAYHKAKHGAKARPLFDIRIGHKKQGGRLSKRRIGL